MVEDILAMVFLFLGAISFSPVGRAIADRIRHGVQPRLGQDGDPAVWEELDRMRGDMTELQERVDFAERLLAKGNESAARDASLGQ